MDLTQTIGLTAVGLWFANGLYLNIKLSEVHDKLDKALTELSQVSQQLDRTAHYSEMAASRYPEAPFDPSDIP